MFVCVDVCVKLFTRTCFRLCGCMCEVIHTYVCLYVWMYVETCVHELIAHSEREETNLLYFQLCIKFFSSPLFQFQYAHPSTYASILSFSLHYPVILFRTNSLSITLINPNSLLVCVYQGVLKIYYNF